MGIWESFERGQVLHKTFRKSDWDAYASQWDPRDRGWGCFPIQHVLTTRVGVECVAHVVQILTDLDHQATVLSVGVHDLILRAAMLEGLFVGFRRWRCGFSMSFSILQLRHDVSLGGRVWGVP